MSEDHEAPEPRMTLVYREENPWLIVKESRHDWRAHQDRFPDYTTSLGCWPAEDMIEFLEEEYGLDEHRWWGFTRDRIRIFAASDQEILEGDE